MRRSSESFVKTNVESRVERAQIVIKKAELLVDSRVQQGRILNQTGQTLFLCNYVLGLKKNLVCFSKKKLYSLKFSISTSHWATLHFKQLFILKKLYTEKNCLDLNSSSIDTLFL